MSRSIRLETRSRARDELRKSMKTIDKVKKWEKKWVPVGSNNCKLKVYKWMPKETDKENINDILTEKSTEEIKEKTESPSPEENDSHDSKSNDPNDKPKESFSSILNGGCDDSRDSFTTMMKYCPDPDSHDSMTESDFTATNMSTTMDADDSNTKTNSKPESPIEPLQHEEHREPDPVITVSDAFKNKDEPKAPSIPENKDKTKQHEHPTVQDDSTADSTANSTDDSTADSTVEVPPSKKLKES